MTIRETRSLAATVALTLLLSGCGGTENPTTDSAMDAALTDAGMDAVGQDGETVDSATSDGDMPDVDTIEDAGTDAAPIDSSVPCPGGDPPDAGTATIASACTTMCAAYFPLCIGPVTNCQTTCEQLSANLTPSQAARVRDCVDINAANECAAAMLCASQVTDCP